MTYAINTTEQNTSEDTARDQAISQAHSITAMVAALDVDYGRLEELREEVREAVADGAAFGEDGSTLDELREELAELEEAAGGCKDADEARERIQEDALGVSVRSGWQSLGEELTPEEFRIVLCTGGPHVEIVGELCQGEPSRAWIEYRGWWSESGELSSGCHYDQAALLRYARCLT